MCEFFVGFVKRTFRISQSIGFYKLLFFFFSFEFSLLILTVSEGKDRFQNLIDLTLELEHLLLNDFFLFVFFIDKKYY